MEEAQKADQGKENDPGRPGGECREVWNCCDHCSWADDCPNAKRKEG